MRQQARSGDKKMTNIKLFTIGFTKTNAQAFFSKLQKAGVTKVIDVRLNNVSQLAGFTKRDDLMYFLKQICECDYVHQPTFAPTKDILHAYKNKHIDWNEYANRYNKLLKDRKAEKNTNIEFLNNACLLCSEPTPENCHRRLLAEYLNEKLHNIEISHL
jgi:uncharacterized protein (DUF488 family)